MFKVGDKVRTTRAHINFAFNKGQETQITSIEHNGAQNVYCTPIFNFFAGEIELVQPAPQAQSHMNAPNRSFKDFTDSLAYSLYYGDSKITTGVDSNKCECGSHAVGVDRHSDYCPLYSKN